MKNSILLFGFSLLSISCELFWPCKDDKISLAKVDYKGTELRIDGYYFGDTTSTGKYVKVYYMYNNGVFLYRGVEPIKDAKENNIVLNIKNELSKKTKGSWGLFQIKDSLIEIERWRANLGGCESTIYERGKILNDTTFVITRREHRKKGKVQYAEEPNSTFYFRPLKTKPDSTNNFIP